MASFEFHRIAERDLRLMNPLSDEKLMLIGQLCRLKPGLRLLDLACGKGEMLCRWAQGFGIHGTGVDYFPAFLNDAAARASQLGVSHALTWAQADAAQYRAEAAAFDVVSCLGASWIGGGLQGTLRLMQPALKPGGLLVVGEPFWADDTPDAAYGAWDQEKGEYVTLRETLGRLEIDQFDLVEMVLSDPFDWDRFEAAQWYAVNDALRERPNDPDVKGAWLWKQKQKRAYLQYARQYFGWGVFVLRQRP